MKFKHTLLSLSVLLFFFVASIASGQNILSPAGKNTQTVSDTTVSPLLPIPTTDITDASSTTYALVTESGKKRLKEDEIQEYTEKVDTLLTVVNDFYENISLDSLDKTSPRELSSHQSKSQIYIGRIDNLQNEISQQSKKSEDIVRQLNDQGKRWQLTLEKDTENALSDALVERINGTIFIIDSLRALVQSDVDVFLAQLDRLSKKRNNLQSLLERLVELNKLSGQSLFKLDTPGLFKVFPSLKDSTLIRSEKENIVKTVKSDTNIFNSQFKSSLIVFGIFLVFLSVFLLWFKKNYLRAIATKKFDLTDISLKLINNPVPVVLFVTTLLIRFIYPDLPETFKLANSTILTLSMIRLIIVIYEGHINSWARWLISLFIISIVYIFLFFDVNSLQRVFLFCISISAFVFFLLMMLKKPEVKVIKDKGPQNLYINLYRIMALLLFVAIVANIVGAFSLAEYFTITPIHIIVIALAIHISTLVANTFIFLILASKTFQLANIFKENIKIIHKKTFRIVRLFLWGFFAVNTLEALRLKDSIFEWGSRVLTEGWTIGDATISLASILTFIFVIWLSIAISRIITAILDKDVFTRVRTAKGIPSTIIMLVKIVLISTGFFLAAAAAGMELRNLSIIIGAFSVGIGFGLQNIFNNLVSGLILAFERPIKVGDTVQVGQLMGVVLVIGFRSSTIRSFDGAEVIVPNGNLISNEMINWTLSDSTRRMDIRIGVAYGTDPEKVIDIILKVADAHERVSDSPQSRGYFVGFGDSSLNFRLLAWTDIEYRLTVESELNIAIEAKLKEAGIEIPFPQRDLHIRSDFRDDGGIPPIEV